MLRIASTDDVAASWLPSGNAVTAALAACGFSGWASDGNGFALAALGVMLCWYGMGLTRLARRRGLTAHDIGRAAAFFSGGALAFAAIGPPLAAYSRELFSMHMLQHMMLIIGAAPLIIWSRPAPMLLRALPPRIRTRTSAAAKALGLNNTASRLLNPIFVWLAFCAGFVLWHAPGPYALGMRYGSIGLAEHLTFFLTALAFWAIAIGSSGRHRLGHGARLLFVLTAAVLTDLPGALMVFAPRPLYPEHAAGAADWGLTLMQDQEIAGLVMWIPGGLAYLAAAAWLFVAWLRDAENRTILSAARSAAPVALLLGIAPLLTGCNPSGAESIPNFNGNPVRGAALIRTYGCGGCHDIPSIADAEGNVGPPLTRMASRIYIAGVLRNTPDNMSLWLREPQRVVPGNAMPQMNIPAQDARDITAYLYTLK